MTKQEFLKKYEIEEMEYFVFKDDVYLGAFEYFQEAEDFIIESWFEIEEVSAEAQNYIDREQLITDLRWKYDIIDEYDLDHFLEFHS